MDTGTKYCSDLFLICFLCHPRNILLLATHMYVVPPCSQTTGCSQREEKSAQPTLWVPYILLGSTDCIHRHSSVVLLTHKPLVSTRRLPLPPRSCEG